MLVSVKCASFVIHIRSFVQINSIRAYLPQWVFVFLEMVSFFRERKRESSG